MAKDVSVFVGSFNVNGEPLTEEMARRWLAKSADSQIVIIGFQEYGTLPEIVFPEPRSFARREEYIRGAGPSAQAMTNERETIAALDAALECGPGQRRVKIADIAMGEPPNTRGRGVAPVSTPPASPSNPSRALEGGSAASPPKPAALMKHPTMNLARDSLATAPEQWHGLIRLIICVDAEMTEQYPSLLRPSGVQTYVVPAGSKHTSVVAPGLSAADMLDSETVAQAADGFEYQNGSTDKGGVGVRLNFGGGGSSDGSDSGSGGGSDRGQGAGDLAHTLLVVCAHFAGTNKYSVPEQHFDLMRLRQLRTVLAACREEGGQIIDDGMNREAASTIADVSPRPHEATILFGDVNFRNELYDVPSDKQRQGKDWNGVRAMLRGEDGAAQNGGAGLVQHACAAATFSRCDRLHKHLARANGSADTAAAYPAAAGESEGGSDSVAELGGALDVSSLAGFHDTLQEQLRRCTCCSAAGVGIGSVGMANNLHPSFTYALGGRHPRDFSSKRTPSWPDRILLSPPPANEGSSLRLPLPAQQPIDGFEFGIEREILVSDHEPVFCRFVMQIPTGAAPPPLR